MLFCVQWSDCRATTESIQEIQHKPPLTVDSLTQQSYISPKMQWAVISYIDTPAFFEINKYTGAPEYIPTVQELLGAIDRQLLLPIDKKQYERLQEVLEIMLQATDIALAIVEIKVAHKDPLFVSLKTTLLQDLQIQKKSIYAMRDALLAIKKPIASWIWKDGFSFKKPFLGAENILYDETLQTIRIPARYMHAINYHTDSEQRKNITHAANLLCKQCLLAIQPYNDTRTVSLHLRGPLSTIGYVYSNILDIYNPHMHTYPLCNYIILLDRTMHTDLVYLRQAVQTALVIVHRNIAMQKSSILHFTKGIHLHALADELAKYDMHLQALCTGRIIEKEKSSDAWFIAKALTATLLTAVFAKFAYGYHKNMRYAAIPYESEEKPNVIYVEETIQEQGNDRDDQDQVMRILQDDDTHQGKTISPQPVQSWSHFFSDIKDNTLRQLKNYYQAFIAAEKSMDMPMEEEDWGAAYERSAREDEEDRKNRQAARATTERTGVLRYFFGRHIPISDDGDGTEDMPDLEFIPEEQERIRKQLAHEAQQEQQRREFERNKINVQDEVERIDNIEAERAVHQAAERAKNLRYKAEEKQHSSSVYPAIAEEDKDTQAHMYASIQAHAQDISQDKNQGPRTTSYWYQRAMDYGRVAESSSLSEEQAMHQELSLNEDQLLLDQAIYDLERSQLQSPAAPSYTKDKTKKTERPRPEVHFSPKIQYEPMHEHTYNSAAEQEAIENTDGLRQRKSSPLSQEDKDAINRLQKNADDTK